MSESYRFVVRGRVQGVFFRQSARMRADELGLHGWVRNRMDGAVEGIAKGEDAAALDLFREWLHHGPRHATVEAVEWSSTLEAVGAGFEVRR